MLALKGDSQRVLKKNKFRARGGGTFSHKCKPSPWSSTQNSCSGFRAEMYFIFCQYYKNTGGKKVHVITNWFAHGRNRLLRHLRERKVKVT